VIAVGLGLAVWRALAGAEGRGRALTRPLYAALGVLLLAIAWTGAARLVPVAKYPPPPSRPAAPAGAPNVVLIVADLLLAYSGTGFWVWSGIALWGLHMGMTQGVLAAMVAHTAPDDLRGTAFGFFNLVSGIAMLIASAVAGLLWDRLGASFAFSAGAGFSVLALLALGFRGFLASAVRPR